MSRSIRNRHDKNGVNIKMCGGDSDKRDKRIANRKFRRQESLEEHATLLNEEDMFKTNDIKDVSNTWEFSSDGLAYYMKLDKDKQYKYKSK